MTELLVGTRKGLFVLQGEPGSPFDVATRVFPGDVVEYAMRDPRSGRYLAAVTSGFYGSRLMYADDPAGEWEHAATLAFPEDTGATLERIWVLKTGEEDGLVYAGVDPAALFESRDGGLTWELNRGLWDQPTRPDWQPGGGGLCLHSIETWPGDPRKLALGISAVGIWLSDDGGSTWRNGNAGLVPRYVPEEAREGNLALCIHNLHHSEARAGTVLHAVPRRRVPERRLRRVVERHRGRSAERLRLPDRGRPRRSGQRVPDPDGRRPRPHDDRRTGARLRDARRRRVVEGARRRPARSRTPTSRSCGKRSVRRARARRWSSTSGPPVARSSAPATPGHRGSRSADIWLRSRASASRRAFVPSAAASPTRAPSPPRGRRSRT